MAQTFNTILSFVKSASRKDRRKGVGSLSVSAVAGGGVGSAADSATQAWVRDNFVDKTTEQEISALKIFSQGIKIGDVSLFKHPDGYVYLDETLVLKGGVVMYGNGSGAEVPSIFDSLPIDGRTIKRDGNGALYVDETALSVSGGGGGVADSVYWNNVIGKPSWIGSTKPTYKYSEIEERPDLSAYFLQTSFTKDNIKSTLGISDWALASAKPTYTASEVGALGVNGTAASSLKMTPEYLTDLNNATPWRFFDMKTGYGSTDGNKPNIAWVSGITGTVAGLGNYRWQIADTTGNERPYFRQESNGTWGNWLSIAFTSDLPTKLSQLTDDVVSGKYLPLAGGTISGDFDINSQTDTTIRYFRMWYYSEGRKNRGMIRVNEDNVALSYYSPTDGVYHPLTIGRDGFKYNTYDILHSGNYSNLLAGGTIKGSITLNNPTSNTTFDAAITLDAKSYGTSSYSQIRWKNGSDVSTRYGYINLKASSYGHGSGVDIGRINGEDNAVWASITATGITATSFIGNLTGNVTGNVSGSSGSCTGNAASATTVRINNAASNVLCPLIFVSNTTAGNKDLFVSTGKSLTFNPSTGGLSAKNFIGNLTGNADSATKLATARTIWGQSFDGTGNITGAMTVDGDATFSSKVIVGTIPVYQSADGTLFVDANVVFRGGVAMYGNTTTTINEE